MATRERLNLFPSRSNFVHVKQRMLSAQKGLVLLKRKRDALEIKLRELKVELNKHNSICDQTIRDANFAMARLDYLGTDLKPHSMLSVTHADVYLRFSYIKTIGVSIPQFDLTLRAPHSFPLTGLARGGIEVEKVRVTFQEALKTLCAMASADYSVKVLDAAVHSNNMRLNGLELVVIPRYQNTLIYIRDEMDEFEREDFYRLKRSQAKRIERLSHDINEMRRKIDDPEKFLEKTKEKEDVRTKNMTDWKAVFKRKFEEAQQKRNLLMQKLAELEAAQGESEVDVGYEHSEFGEEEEEEDDFFYAENTEGEIELKQGAMPEAEVVTSAGILDAAAADLESASETEQLITNEHDIEAHSAIEPIASQTTPDATEFPVATVEDLQQEEITEEAVSKNIVESQNEIAPIETPHKDSDEDSASSSNEEVVHTDVLSHPEAKSQAVLPQEVEQAQNLEAVLPQEVESPQNSQNAERPENSEEKK